jgi:hypothetical protein
MIGARNKSRGPKMPSDSGAALFQIYLRHQQVVALDDD